MVPLIRYPTLPARSVFPPINFSLGFVCLFWSFFVLECDGLPSSRLLGRCGSTITAKDTGTNGGSYRYSVCCTRSLQWRRFFSSLFLKFAIFASGYLVTADYLIPRHQYICGHIHSGILLFFGCEIFVLQACKRFVEIAATAQAKAE
jgi:hypothetical protein